MDYAQLRRNLEYFFDESELRNLCFDLRIDYDNLRGESKSDKVRELLAWCIRRQREEQLLKAIMILRPQNEYWLQQWNAFKEEQHQSTNEFPVIGDNGRYLKRSDRLVKVLIAAIILLVIMNTLSTLLMALAVLQ